MTPSILLKALASLRVEAAVLWYEKFVNSRDEMLHFVSRTNCGHKALHTLNNLKGTKKNHAPGKPSIVAFIFRERIIFSSAGVYREIKWHTRL